MAVVPSVWPSVLSGLVLGGVVLATLVRHALHGLLKRRRIAPAPVDHRQTARRAA